MLIATCYIMLMALLDLVLSVVAPHDCLVCGLEGRLVCGWCAPDAFPDLPSRCYRCKQITSDFAVCESCCRITSLRHVWIRTDYDTTAKELMRIYKYERVSSAHKTITEAMDEILPYLPVDTIIIPIPTATSRVRQRGYDQAELLARSLARQRSLLWVRAVTRLTQSRQVGADRHQRLSQLKNAFMVTKPLVIKNANILLVDDVVTTGATIEAMAATLKQAGAKSITAIAFAQKH